MVDVAVDCLVSHLSELVRMAFIAATSDCDKLRLAGLAALQVKLQSCLFTLFVFPSLNPIKPTLILTLPLVV